jgi:NAD dependent epimerase/dehydratase family enzyme
MARIGDQGKGQSMLARELLMTLKRIGTYAKNERVEILDVLVMVSERTGFSCAAVGEIPWIEIQDEVVLVSYILEPKEISGVEFCLK